MGCSLLLFLAFFAASQGQLSFTFNETFALYAAGAFWDSTWSHLAFLGTTHMPDSHDALFFQDNRGVVFNGGKIVRLPPHPLDPSPFVLNAPFSLEFWFRTSVTAMNTDRYLLLKVHETLPTPPEYSLGAKFKVSPASGGTQTFSVLDLWASGGTTIAATLQFSTPATAGLTDSWDRWFHMVISVYLSGSSTVGDVFLDGVIVASGAPLLTTAFTDPYPNGAIYLGGKATSNYDTVDTTTSTTSATSTLIYTVKLYQTRRTEVQVKAAISNTCLGRFDNGNLKYMCDACPVNYGKCLFSGCASTGFQRASSDCQLNTACDASCNAGNAGGYCVSDIECAACTQASTNSQNYYLTQSGQCKICREVCQTCSGPAACHECLQPTSDSSIFGGVLLTPRACSGSLALRMDGTCHKAGLALPLPTGLSFTSWTLEVWVYMVDTNGDTNGNYEIVNLGDYSLTYSGSSFYMYNKLRNYYNNPNPLNAFSYAAGQWVRVAFSLTSGPPVAAQLMVWTKFVVNQLSTATSSKFDDDSIISTGSDIYSSPTQLLLCNKLCNVYFRDLRLWNVVRSEQDVFNSLFLVFTQPPTSLVSYWPLDDNNPVILDNSYNYLNLTLPQSRGVDCWWVEQAIQFLRFSSNDLADTSVFTNSGTKGFLQCPAGRPNADIVFLCNQEIRYVFSQKCMRQDIPDINMTVIGRRGASDLADSADPIYDGKNPGLYFNGSSYIEIDPKRQAFQPVSETRSKSRQVDARSTRMPLSLAAFTLEAWINPSALPSGTYSFDSQWITGTNIQALFSIMHTNGNHQLLWFLTSNGIGISLRDAPETPIVSQSIVVDTSTIPTGAWTFVAFSFSLNSLTNFAGSKMVFMLNKVASATTTSGSLGFGIYDFIVRNQSPMYIGAVVQGTVLGAFFTGNIFEFALSNYFKTSSWINTYDLDPTSSTPISSYFGAVISNGNMQGNACACHFSCLTCTAGYIQPNACTSCAASYVLTPSNTCDLTCPSGYSIDSTRKCVVVTAPAITSIVFNSAFSGIDITIDSAVQPITNTNDCSLYLSQDTNSLLGFDSYCYMRTATVLSVLFGRLPTLGVGSPVRLRPKSFLKINASVVTYNAETPFNVPNFTTTPQPTAVLAAPNLSPVNGQGVTIDATFSTGALGRPLSFMWSVTGDLPFSPALVQALNKYTTYDQSFGKLTISASLVPENQWVVYTVTVKNWLGGISTLSLNSYHTLRPVPILYFIQGRLQTVKRAQQNTFQLKLTKSTYGPIAPDSLLNIRIIDTNANLTTYPWNPNVNFFAGNNMTLIIPPLTLQTGTFYLLAAEFTSVLYPERNTYASLRINAVASNLVAKIVGGDRVIGDLDQINVTAAGSYDPDIQSNATLAYSWACPLCSNSTGTGFFFYSQIPSTTATPVLVTVTLTVSTTVIGDTRTTTEYSEFQFVSDVTRPYIFIDRLTNSTNNQLLPERSNYLNAVLYNKNSTVRIRQHVAWSATPAPVSFTPGFSPKKHFLNTRILPDNLNLPTSNYKFTLTLDEDGVHTYAWLRVTVNAQPTGCCLTVTRVLESRNLHLFEAGMHEDPDGNYPLLYKFGLDKYSIDLNFGRFTSQGNYILPAYDNPDMNYQQTVYAIVTDSLGAYTQHTLVVQVYPETPAYALTDFISTAAQTYSPTYNQTIMDQYVLASYGSYLTDKIQSKSEGFSASTATKEFDVLAAKLADLLTNGDQTCTEYRVYVQDLWLIGQQASLLSSSAMDSIVASASSLLSKVYANPDQECWSEVEKELFFAVVDSIALYYPDHTTSQGQITGLLETFGFTVLRNTYPSQSLTYLGNNVMAKYWRINAETPEEFFTFTFDELNNTQFALLGFTIPAATLTTKTPNALLDIHVIGSNFNPYAPLRLNAYPDFLAARSLERLEIKENGDITSYLVDVRLYDSGTVSEDQITTLVKPTPSKLTITKVEINLPLIGYNSSEFIATTCETWTPATSNGTQAYGGLWTNANCFQNATIDLINAVATCTCTHLTTFASNQLTTANLGPLRLNLNQPTLDPYYDLQKEINDNRNFMFYMNPIYLLFLLWSLHGGLLILSYVADREGKPDFDRDEYNLIARSDRSGVREEIVPPLPSFIAYWANEWYVTGLIRSMKPHYTRCARTNILFSKMYVLLIVPGFFYTYYWTKNEAFNIQGYDWGVVVISLIFSAFAQGVLSVLSNTRNVPVSIKRGVYVAYFGLWTTMWLAIGFWTAKGTTQTASIWCVMWILCAFTDILVLDHIYVMVKWGFDSTTDYWRAVEVREAAAASSN